MAKYFEKILLHSEYDKGLIHNVQLLNSDGDFVAIEAGDLVNVTGLALDSTLTTLSGSNIIDYSGFKTSAPVALTDKVLLCDPAMVKTQVDGKNVYRVGNETYGNVLPAGRFARARELKVLDTFWLGADNFVSAPTVGKFASPTIGSVKWTPSATVPVAGLVIKIEGYKMKTTGAEEGFKIYACRVIQDTGTQGNDALLAALQADYADLADAIDTLEETTIPALDARVVALEEV